MASSSRSTRSNRKRWGRVQARPSEYLIKLKAGKVARHGPGLSVFVWPWQTYTILSTAIQRTAFVADQISAEKVGVAVTGIAVYRVAEPLLAFRMLDLDQADGGEANLSGILREMFIGAARRLVANMTVHDCLTRRKEGIAQELMREIQPVVSGRGRPIDSTEQGWGVVIDTIEIQDVRILSEKVFADLQAPFRSSLEMEARKSAVQRDQEVHLSEVAAQREMLQVDQDLARRRCEAEQQSRLSALEREERLQMTRIEQQERMEQARLLGELAGSKREQEKAAADHALNQLQGEQRADLARTQAQQQAELARQRAADQIDLQRTETEARLALAELEGGAEVEAARREVEATRLRGELSTRLRAAEREIDTRFSEDQIRYALVTEGLPAICQALVTSLGDVNVTQIQAGGGDREEGAGGLSPVAAALAQALAVARASGLDLGAILPARPARCE